MLVGFPALTRVVVAGFVASACSAPSESSEALIAPGTFSAVFSGALTDSITGRAVFAASGVKIFIQMEGPPSSRAYQMFLLNIPPDLAPGDYHMSGIPASDGTVPNAYLLVNAGIGQVRSRSGTLTVLRTSPTEFAGRADIDAAAEPAFTQNATLVRAFQCIVWRALPMSVAGAHSSARPGVCSSPGDVPPNKELEQPVASGARSSIQDR